MNNLIYPQYSLLIILAQNMKASILKFLKISAGPLSGLLIYYLILLSQSDLTVARMAGIATWMAVWWIFESVPLPITSLLPVFLFPLGGIMSTKTVAPVYMNDVLFLFVGGFILAFAMEKWNLHKRIALKIILLIGSDYSKILLGMMVASYFLSMWISNTATTMMMIPTTLAVIGKISETSNRETNKFSTGLLLGIAYAASIGGTATLVGTPPNLIFLSHYMAAFPDKEPVSFLQWFMFGLPVSLVFLFITYQILKNMYTVSDNGSATDKLNIFENEYRSLGKMVFEEKVVTVLFIVMAVLWFTRADLMIGNIVIPGWSGLFNNPEYFQDGTVAIFIATLLFIIPSKQHSGEMIMNWETVKKLPYGIILLFGGGFALAKGFIESGLTDWLATQLDAVGTLPVYVIILILCTFMTFLTEITSNMATTQLVLPIFAALAIGADIDPLYLMIPVTFSASFAFMLPVATAPNTIIFGSEKLEIMDMVKTGIRLNLVGIVVVTLAMILLGRFVFNLT